MARWLVEVRDVDDRVISTERFVLRRNAEEAARRHNKEGRYLAESVKLGARPEDARKLPDAAYTARVVRG